MPQNLLPEWVMSEKIVLKKYANRRIYDPERSGYITLEQVSELIRNGRQVSVIDARTSEDVTAFILSQIIVEEAKNKNVLLPVPFLHLVIQYREEVLAEFFEKYLELTIKNYLLYKGAFDENFRNWLDVGRQLSSMAGQSMPAPARLGSLFDLFFSADKKSGGEDPQS
jgi:polyhydroxyalkanoate synthesis repressor PhaR